MLSSIEREQLCIHDTAKGFPDMEPDKYWEFRADLIKNGMRDPILVSKDHKRLLDGRHRKRACDEVRGIQPVFAEFQGKPEDEASIIISLNLFRRHLTDKQRTALVSKLLGPQYEKEARERMERGRPPKEPTVKSGQRSSPAGSDVVILKSPEVLDEPTASGETADRIAAVAKTTQHQARQAEWLRKHDPQALDQVIEGKPTKKRRPTKTLTFSEQVWRKWSSWLVKWSPADRRKVKELVAGYLKDDTA
jgi:hypothetical protein